MAMDQAVVSLRTRRESVSAMQSPSQAMGGGLTFSGYQTDGFFDEMFDDLGRPRSVCQSLFQCIRNTSTDDLIRQLPSFPCSRSAGAAPPGNEQRRPLRRR